MKIAVECCVDCHTHEWCSWHDEAKYFHFFKLVEAAARRVDPECFIDFNPIPPNYSPYDKFSQLLPLHKYFDIEDSKVKQYPRHGAFEVIVNNVLVFSKIKARMWPSIDRITHLFQDIVEALTHNTEADLSAFSIERRLDDHRADERFFETYKGDKRSPNARPASSQPMRNSKYRISQVKRKNVYPDDQRENLNQREGSKEKRLEGLPRRVSAHKYHPRDDHRNRMDLRVNFEQQSNYSSPKNQPFAQADPLLEETPLSQTYHNSANNSPALHSKPIRRLDLRREYAAPSAQSETRKPPNLESAAASKQVGGLYSKTSALPHIDGNGSGVKPTEDPDAVEVLPLASSALQGSPSFKRKIHLIHRPSDPNGADNASGHKASSPKQLEGMPAKQSARKELPKKLELQGSAGLAQQRLIKNKFSLGKKMEGDKEKDLKKQALLRPMFPEKQAGQESERGTLKTEPLEESEGSQCVESKPLGKEGSHEVHLTDYRQAKEGLGRQHSEAAPKDKAGEAEAERGAECESRAEESFSPKTQPNVSESASESSKKKSEEAEGSERRVRTPSEHQAGGQFQRSKEHSAGGRHAGESETQHRAGSREGGSREGGSREGGSKASRNVSEQSLRAEVAQPVQELGSHREKGMKSSEKELAQQENDYQDNFEMAMDGLEEDIAEEVAEPSKPPSNKVMPSGTTHIDQDFLPEEVDDESAKGVKSVTKVDLSAQSRGMPASSPQTTSSLQTEPLNQEAAALELKSRTALPTQTGPGKTSELEIPQRLPTKELLESVTSAEPVDREGQMASPGNSLSLGLAEELETDVKPGDFLDQSKAQQQPDHSQPKKAKAGEVAPRLTSHQHITQVPSESAKLGQEQKEESSLAAEAKAASKMAGSPRLAGATPGPSIKQILSREAGEQTAQGELPPSRVSIESDHATRHQESAGESSVPVSAHLHAAVASHSKGSLPAPGQASLKRTPHPAESVDENANASAVSGEAQSSQKEHIPSHGQLPSAQAQDSPPISSSAQQPQPGSTPPSRSSVSPPEIPMESGAHHESVAQHIPAETPSSQPPSSQPPSSQPPSSQPPSSQPPSITSSGLTHGIPSNAEIKSNTERMIEKESTEELHRLAEEVASAVMLDRPVAAPEKASPTIFEATEELERESDCASQGILTSKQLHAAQSPAPQVSSRPKLETLHFVSVSEVGGILSDEPSYAVLESSTHEISHQQIQSSPKLSQTDHPELPGHPTFDHASQDSRTHSRPHVQFPSECSSNNAISIQNAFSQDEIAHSRPHSSQTVPVRTAASISPSTNAEIGLAEEVGAETRPSLPTEAGPDFDSQADYPDEEEEFYEESADIVPDSSDYTVKTFNGHKKLFDKRTSLDTRVNQPALKDKPSRFLKIESFATEGEANASAQRTESAKMVSQAYPQGNSLKGGEPSVRSEFSQKAVSVSNRGSETGAPLRPTNGHSERSIQETKSGKAHDTTPGETAQDTKADDTPLAKTVQPAKTPLAVVDSTPAQESSPLVGASSVHAVQASLDSMYDRLAEGNPSQTHLAPQKLVEDQEPVEAAKQRSAEEKAILAGEVIPATPPQVDGLSTNILNSQATLPAKEPIAASQVSIASSQVIPEIVPSESNGVPMKSRFFTQPTEAKPGSELKVSALTGNVASCQEIEPPTSGAQKEEEKPKEIHTITSISPPNIEVEHPSKSHAASPGQVHVEAQALTPPGTVQRTPLEAKQTEEPLLEATPSASKPSIQVSETGKHQHLPNQLVQSHRAAGEMAVSAPSTPSCEAVSLEAEMPKQVSIKAVEVSMGDIPSLREVSNVRLSQGAGPDPGQAAKGDEPVDGHKHESSKHQVTHQQEDSNADRHTDRLPNEAGKSHTNPDQMGGPHPHIDTLPGGATEESTQSMVVSNSQPSPARQENEGVMPVSTHSVSSRTAQAANEYTTQMVHEVAENMAFDSKGSLAEEVAQGSTQSLPRGPSTSIKDLQETPAPPHDSTRELSLPQTQKVLSESSLASDLAIGESVAENITDLTDKIVKGVESSSKSLASQPNAPLDSVAELESEHRLSTASDPLMAEHAAEHTPFDHHETGSSRGSIGQEKTPKSITALPHQPVGQSVPAAQGIVGLSSATPQHPSGERSEQGGDKGQTSAGHLAGQDHPPTGFGDAKITSPTSLKHEIGSIAQGLEQAQDLTKRSHAEQPETENPSQRETHPQNPAGSSLKLTEARDSISQQRLSGQHPGQQQSQQSHHEQAQPPQDQPRPHHEQAQPPQDQPHLHHEQAQPEQSAPSIPHPQQVKSSTSILNELPADHSSETIPDPGRNPVGSTRPHQGLASPQEEDPVPNNESATTHSSLPPPHTSAAQTQASEGNSITASTSADTSSSVAIAAEPAPMHPINPVAGSPSSAGPGLTTSATEVQSRSHSHVDTVTSIHLGSRPVLTQSGPQALPELASTSKVIETVIDENLRNMYSVIDA